MVGWSMVHGLTNNIGNIYIRIKFWEYHQIGYGWVWMMVGNESIAATKLSNPLEWGWASTNIYHIRYLRSPRGFTQ